MLRVNRFGERYHFPKEEINAVDQLKPGDHIAFESNVVYWHHMIVEKVEKEQKKFTLSITIIVSKVLLKKPSQRKQSCNKVPSTLRIKGRLPKLLK